MKKRMKLITTAGKKAAIPALNDSDDPLYNNLYFSTRWNSNGGASDIGPFRHFTNNTDWSSISNWNTPLVSNPNSYKSSRFGQLGNPYAFGKSVPPKVITGDFCIDFFANYYDWLPTDRNTAIISTEYNSWGSGTFFIGCNPYNGSNWYNRTCVISVDLDCYFQTPDPIVLNVWKHYAFERKGTTVTFYVNGEVKFTDTQSRYGNPVGDPRWQWAIGHPGANTGLWDSKCYVYAPRMTLSSRFNGSFTIDPAMYVVG